MNTISPKFYSARNLFFLIFLHLSLVWLGGYFLSPEFSLYPYLTHHGFLPFRDLIDQHLPTILFGPFSLPYFLVETPQKTITLFLSIIFLTDLFLYFYLVRTNHNHRWLILFVWISLSSWLGINTLWLETFICFYLSVIFYLRINNQKRINQLALGFFIGLLVLVKPQLLPAILILCFLAWGISIPALCGFMIPTSITGFYLFKYNIISAFINLVFKFNANQYIQLAFKKPTLREVTISLLLFFICLILIDFKKRKNFLALVCALLFALNAFPRFELFHLLPSLLVLIYFSSPKITLFKSFLVVALCIVLFSLFTFKSIVRPKGNFYYDQKTYEVSNYLKTRPKESSLYIIGGNDLIYPLSNRIPPSFTYLPPFPWYFKNQDLLDLQIMSLMTSPGTLILVNPQATLGGQNLLESSGRLGQLIKSTYKPTQTIAGYQVYELIP